MGIKTGTRVSIQAQPDGKLLINPVIEGRSIKTKRIDVTGCGAKALERDIIAAYLHGYDMIELFSERILVEQKQTIRRVCYKLIGHEITEENSNCVVIQDLLNPNELPIKKGVQRMFLIAVSMQKDAVRAFKTIDHDLALDVSHRDDEVDRLYLLISKQFRSILCEGGMPSNTETSIEEYHEFRMAASPLERIADHAQKIANTALKLQEPVNDKVMEEIDKLNAAYTELVKQSVEALFETNISLANQVIDNVDNMRAWVEELHESILKLKSNEIMISLGTVVDSLSRIGDLSSNIAEIAINMAIRDR
ncbi:toxin-antitoxin system, toxin component [Methanosarcina sp. A14]|uniref:Transcriptional regulator PhoU n=3 Tax=Methanosarcina barkeri TaxID=2208 RepID=A0A0E3QU48_METBA|nr:phosphate uptake regulator PhoU [Methanosarcina barkeri]AKB54110.1 transcriptional regulator PhoU [Methanosarcina barkeri MS]AKB57816.1 transcriptional regulator PhoU [Methanosarcina barkeri 227]AKJ38362.1 PhoU family protein [Methanosarcina barkeri CM1]OED10316.1 toxin-antitoxin system, toxin component [Methanosarcina sp. A14]